MPKVLTPNINFVPSSPKEILNPAHSAAVWSMAELNTVVEDMGYDGIEYHDTNFFRHSLELRRAQQPTAVVIGRLIVTGHESWVGTADPQPKNTAQARTQAKGSLVDEVKSKLVFPTGPRSVASIARLQEKLGRQLPFVAFPDVLGRVAVDQEKLPLFQEVNIQPTIDVAAAWGVDSPEGFAEELQRRKLGVVWDHFHGDRRGKVVDGQMKQEDYLPPLLKAGLVRAIHIGIFRADFERYDPGRTVTSINEGRLMMQENQNFAGYPIDDLATELTSYGWQGNVTIESPLPGMEAGLGEPISMTNLRNYHTNMVQNIKSNLLAEVHWD